MKDAPIRFIKVAFSVMALFLIFAFIAIEPVKADEMPPLYLEMHLPLIANNPLSIGEPPEVPNE